MSTVESIYAMAGKWTVARLRAWAIREGYRPMKPAEIVGHEIRYRIKDPRQFKRFVTRILPNGVHLVLGWKSASRAKSPAKRSTRKKASRR